MHGETCRRDRIEPSCEKTIIIDHACAVASSRSFRDGDEDRRHIFNLANQRWMNLAWSLTAHLVVQTDCGCLKQCMILELGRAV